MNTIRNIGVTSAIAVMVVFCAILVSKAGKIEYRFDAPGANASSTREKMGQSKDGDLIHIVMGGDVMFDRNIRQRGEKLGYTHFFEQLKNFFDKADLVVVNLEGPITTNDSETVLKDGTYTKKLKFTFATSTALVLKEVGIDLVSLANNHTDNFLYEGLVETKEWLSRNGVRYFGDPWNTTATEAKFEISGIKVAFVGYHYFLGGFERVLADVSRLDGEGYFVIVMPHWGEEYFKTHSEIMEEKAVELIEYGADAIVGAHPHVVMDHDWFGDVPVFYSLGNLLFDQYFSNEVKRGNIIRLNIRKVGFGAKIESVEIFEVYNSSDKGIMFDETNVKVEVM